LLAVSFPTPAGAQVYDDWVRQRVVDRKLDARRVDVEAQVIMRDEQGQVTKSLKDLNRRQLIEYTLDTNDVVILQKVFALDVEGRPLEGRLYDGKDQLIGIVEFGYDNFGRIEEERTYDSRGRVVRRLIHRYDAAGRTSAPFAVSFNPDAPSATPTPIAAAEAQSLVQTPGVLPTQVPPNLRQTPAPPDARPGEAPVPTVSTARPLPPKQTQAQQTPAGQPEQERRRFRLPWSRD